MKKKISHVIFQTQKRYIILLISLDQIYNFENTYSKLEIIIFQINTKDKTIDAKEYFRNPTQKKIYSKIKNILIF